jgi:glutaminase
MAYVSTGSLPGAEVVAAVVTEAYERFRADAGGAVSDVYPALARVRPDTFGICVASAAGESYATGDADVEFTIMSVAKPFVFALIGDVLGPDEIRRRVGVDATGLPFNSITAVERGDGRTNPMVNSGAIATTSFTPGDTIERKWEFLLAGLSRFAGRQLAIDDEVYASAAATNHRNQALARLLHSFDALGCDPAEATELYTRQSCVRVTARDLAMMAAVLADGGVHPVTRVAVVDPLSARCALAVMTTAGLYETSGDWLFRVGLPGKSGIGGGMVTVSPGKGGLGTFAPRLDPAGNSVKGQLTAQFLARELGLDLFQSAPAGEL